MKNTKVILNREDINNPLHPNMFENLIEELVRKLKGQTIFSYNLENIDSITLTVSDIDVDLNLD